MLCINMVDEEKAAQAIMKLEEVVEERGVASANAS